MRRSLTRSEYVTVGVMGGVVLLLGAYVWHTQRSVPDEPPPERPLADLAASSTYSTIAGEPISLDTSGYDLTIVTTWATWCPHCQQHLAEIQRVAGEVPAPYRIRTLAFNRSDSPALIRQFLAQYPLPDGMEVVADPTDSLYAHIDGRTMPETLVLDRAGNLVLHYQNAPNADRFKAELQAALVSE